MDPDIDWNYLAGTGFGSETDADSIDSETQSPRKRKQFSTDEERKVARSAWNKISKQRRVTKMTGLVSDCLSALSVIKNILNGEQNEAAHFTKEELVEAISDVQECLNSLRFN
jgi:acetyl-CoA carboxylase alpha subunit